MKHILFILGIILIASCKKDDVDPNASANGAFTPTNTSFSELDLSQTTNADLYIIELNVNDDANGMILDLNADGQGDLRINGSADQDWFGQTATSESNLTLTPLNQNTFLLSDSNIDSTFNFSTSDTNTVNIQYYQLTSSDSTAGSNLTQTNTNFYCTHEDNTATVLANDSRWVSNSQIIRDHYKSTSSYYYGPDANGFYLDIEDVIQYKRGIVPNSQISWIPIKFISSEGNVKLGYLKLRPSLSFGFINVGLSGWAIQR